MYPAFPLEYKPVSFTISARCHPPETGETNFYRGPHLAPVSRIPPQPIAPKNLDVYALGVLQVWILSRNFLALCRTVERISIGSFANSCHFSILSPEGKHIIFSSSLRRVFDKIRQKRINSKHRIVGWKEWKGGGSSFCSGIFMKSISIRRHAEWIWIQVRGVRLGDDRRATISWNFAGERYSAELAKHLTNMKAFKQRGSRATIPPPTSKEMPNRVSLKCSSQLGEQSGRTWNYLGIAQTESSPGISLVPSYENLISMYDYNFSSIFYRIFFEHDKCIFDSSNVPWILLLDS